MDKHVDPAIQERIRALCKQVTVAYDLDAEIQEELYGHMEDKFLAYLSGEECVSEEDALILVREHFGDAEVVRGLLQAVHESETDTVGIRASLSRRLTAMWVLSMAVVLFKDVLMRLGGALPADPIAVFVSLGLIGNTMGAATVWMVSLTWQRRLRRGDRPWFVRWYTPWMWAAALTMLVAPLCLPKTTFVIDYGSAVASYVTNPRHVNLFVPAVLVFGVSILQLCAWFWWADRPPRPRRAHELAFGCIIGFSLYVDVLALWNPAIRLHGIDPASTRSTTLTAINCLVVALLVYGAYQLARRTRRRWIEAQTRRAAVA